MGASREEAFQKGTGGPSLRSSRALTSSQSSGIRGLAALRLRAKCGQPAAASR